jgi:hypothetical protein
VTRIRRLAYPLRLARLRLARRLERVFIVGLGIAAGAAMLAAVLGGSLVAQDRGLARAADRIAPADRAVRALWFGIPAQDAPRARLDAWAQPVVGRFGNPVRAMVFRQTSVDGRLFDLAAVDGVRRFVRLVSGRLPRQCTPARCEVVQLGGRGPLPEGLGLVRVGRARLDSELPLGNVLTRETASGLIRSAVAYHTPSTPPFLLAEGAAATADLPALDFQYRSYVWTAPLEPDELHPWNAGSFSRRVERARSELATRSAQFAFDAPTEAVAAAVQESRVAGRRLLLIGGEAAALLLAFVVLAATRLRRDADAAWRRLTWFGARRWQLVVLSAGEAALIAAGGAAIGWAIGCGAAALAANRANADTSAVLRHGPLDGGGLLTAGGLVLASAIVLLAAMRTKPLRLGGITLTPLDALALGALAVAAGGLARGDADAASLAQANGTGAFLLLLPGLLAFAVAIATARVLTPTLRLLERRARNAPVATRLAVLSLARNPGYAAVATAFVVISVGLALFAQSYRATLEQGQREQASFAVPVDAIVREDLSKLVPVLDARPPAAYERVGRTDRVVRLSGGLPRASVPFTLLGLSPQAAGQFAPGAAPRLRFSGHLRAIALAPGTQTFSLPVVLRGDPLRVTASFALTRERFATVSLGIVRGRTVLRARLPDGARQFLGLTLEPADTGLHVAANAGTGAQTIARGTLRFGPLEGTTTSAAIRGTVNYVVSPDSPTRLLPGRPTGAVRPTVLATPRLAATANSNGLLAVEIEGHPLVVRVSGTIQRFPTVFGDVLVANREAVLTALNGAAPGSARTNELWLSDVRDPRALQRPPFDALEVRTHAEELAELRGDPLARGTLYVLAGAALVALALALLGLALGLVADARDEHGELFDLESQGARPSTLRSQVRRRAFTVGAFGLAGGAAAGALLVFLVVDLVTLAAGAGRPEPPLRLALGWETLVVGFATFVAVAVVLAYALPHRAFRERAAGRWMEVGA